MCTYGNSFSTLFFFLSFFLFSEEKDAIYGTRHQEAVKIFNALLAQDSLADPIKQVQDILQKCSDIEDLQSEVIIIIIGKVSHLGSQMRGATIYTYMIYIFLCMFRTFFQFHPVGYSDIISALHFPSYNTYVAV